MRAFAESYTAAWCSQDPAQVAAHFAPNGSLQVNAAPPAVGREAITAVAQSFMTAFPDLAVAMDSLDEANLVYHWTLTGGHVKISGYEQWTLDAEGLILNSLGHFDEADYQRQLACPTS
jgi:hypothetical protein